MEYLNLDAVSYETFQKQHPYPWLNLQGSLTAEGFELLRETLPDNSLFERNVGVKRAHGQAKS